MMCTHFAFNLSRQANEELILLECFTVPEAGVFSVLLYEVELGGAIGYHITCGLPDVIIKPGIIQCCQTLIFERGWDGHLAKRKL